tara:strand:+ start:36 stop:3224 length:3189 start_codon:yes stop_codon:yes gene_type:complete
MFQPNPNTTIEDLQKATQTIKDAEPLKGQVPAAIAGSTVEIIELIKDINDINAQYGGNTRLFSHIAKPLVDKAQKEMGREKFTKVFNELAEKYDIPFKDDPNNPFNLIGDVIGLGGAARFGKAVVESTVDLAKQTKNIFKDPPDMGLKPELAGVGKVDDINTQTDKLLDKTPPKSKAQATINPAMIGLNTPIGRKQSEKFLDLEKKGDMSPEQLFEETKVYRGVDGKLRYELDDTNAELKNIDNLVKDIELKKTNKETITLGKVLAFDDLYQQYFKEIKVGEKTYKPIKDIEVEFISNSDEAVATYNPFGDKLRINLDVSKNMSPEKKKEFIASSILHEVQHAIQHREGFIKGTSIDMELRNMPRYNQYVADKQRLEGLEDRAIQIANDGVVPYFSTNVSKLKQNEIIDKLINYPRGKAEIKKLLLETTDLSPLEIDKAISRNKALKDKIDVLYTSTNNREATARKNYFDKYGEREARLVEERYKNRLAKKGLKDDELFKTKKGESVQYRTPDELVPIAGFKQPTLRIDNPGKDFMGVEYTDKKIKSALLDKNEAIKRGETDTAQANIGNFSGVTGYFDAPLRIDPKILKDVKGMNGEHKIRNNSAKLRELKESIEKEGFKQNEDAILVHVREDGVPFITEGNHRLAEALQSGRENILVNIQYLRGSEKVEGLLNPKRLLEEKNISLPLIGDKLNKEVIEYYQKKGGLKKKVKQEVEDEIFFDIERKHGVKKRELLKDREGEPLKLYMGLQNPTKLDDKFRHTFGKFGKDDMAEGQKPIGFASSNPLLADGFASRYLRSEDMKYNVFTGQNVVPFYIKPKKVIEYKPLYDKKGNMESSKNWFEFDRQALTIPDGHVLVWRDGIEQHTRVIPELKKAIPNVKFNQGDVYAFGENVPVFSSISGKELTDVAPKPIPSWMLNQSDRSRYIEEIKQMKQDSPVLKELLNKAEEISFKDMGRIIGEGINKGLDRKGIRQLLKDRGFDDDIITKYYDEVMPRNLRIKTYANEPRRESFFDEDDIREEFAETTQTNPITGFAESTLGDVSDIPDLNKGGISKQMSNLGV